MEGAVGRGLAAEKLRFCAGAEEAVTYDTVLDGGGGLLELGFSVTDRAASDSHQDVISVNRVVNVLDPIKEGQEPAWSEIKEDWREV